MISLVRLHMDEGEGGGMDRGDYSFLAWIVL